MTDLSNSVIRKFTEVFSADDWEVATDTGWESLVDVKQTTEYQIWQMTLSNGITLECADTHIVFDQHLNQRFVCDLQVGDFVLTDSGPTALSSVTTVESREHMYDLGVDSSNHRYYTNGILSHNTSTAAGYLLWQAMFRGDQTILIAAHAAPSAREIMHRIRYGYDHCPDFIKPDLVGCSQGQLKFDNGTKIIVTTCNQYSGHGTSISLVYFDELALVPFHVANRFFQDIAPGMSHGGRVMINSTYATDGDMFAKIWKDANHRVDIFGNPQELGINGFFPYTCHWSERQEFVESCEEVHIE